MNFFENWRWRLSVAALAASFLISGVGASFAADTDFATWLKAFRTDAEGQGISARTLNLALANIEPIPHVIELDHKQPEFTLTFADYIAHVVPEARVERGRELLQENRALLEKIAAKYNVQPQYIVALWGIESDYGRITGDFPVIPSLATLAYDGRRSAYFRGELIAALRILDRGLIDLDTMRGSWAGAMGQSQFMPSSYLHYAVDFEGKGHRDIWHDSADVFASTANYLSQLGWKGGETWGHEVQLPPNFDSKLADLGVRKPALEWEGLGVHRMDGGPLPDPARPASVVLPGGEGGPAYLVYDNYRTIMKWNHSTYFATAVGLLADRIAGQ
jgi:membrane-bound lytic murein transglycosylase B